MRRGLVLIAVLLLTVALAAGLTAMLSGVRGQSEAVFSIAQRHEQRLAARSAAYAIAQELGAAREQILAGELPEIAANESVIRAEHRSGWGWSLGGDDGSGGLENLAGRLDVNVATDEMLAALLPHDAEAVTAASPIRTPGALRQILDHEHDDAESENDSGLIERLTLFSIDPQLRSGAGGPAGSRGTPRIGIESGASTPIGLSVEGAALFDGIADGSWRPSSLGHILREASARGIPQEDWDLLLDAVYIENDKPRRGLIDLNHADETVLASLPGLDSVLAGAIVDRRESLSGEDRSGLSWPVRDGVVDLDTYAQLVDRLTVRSMQIGVRFRVVSEPEELGVNAEFNAPRLEADLPEIEYHGVVDLSGTRPRFVYLRETTYESWEGGVRLVKGAEEPSDESEDFDSFPEDLPAGGDTPDQDIDQEQPQMQDASGAWGRFVAGRGTS